MAGLVLRLLRRPAVPARPASPSPTSPPASPPVFLEFRSSTVFIVTTISVAIFTDIFLYGLIVPVLPYVLATRVGVPESQTQRWNAILFACYGIALCVCSPLAGLYADQSSSRRLPLMLGLLALAGSTLLLCLGRHISLLAVARLLQGASAAVVWSVGLALLADTMGSRMGLALGFVGIAMSVGLLLAPLVGGFVYAGTGYYTVFYVAFGLILLDIAMRVVLIEKKVARRWLSDAADEDAEADTGSDAGRSAGAVNAEKTPDAAPDAPDTSPGAEVASAPTPAHLLAPGMLRRVGLLLRSCRLVSALFGCIVMASIMTSFDTILPLFVEDLFGWGSTASGLLFLAPYLPPAILSPVVGAWTDRWGAKWLALTGFVPAIPLLVCLRLVDHDTLGEKVLLAVLLSLLGVVLTFGNVPVMAEISFAIEAENIARPGLWGPTGVYGIGYGLYTMSFALGTAVGSLMAGYLRSFFGWGTATWALAVWCAVGTAVVFLWVGEFHAGPPNAPTRASG